MRHRVAHRKLGRITPHRMALLRNLATALFEKERIRTTLPKAKELRPYAEKLITLAKREDDRLHARRQAAAQLRDPGVVQKLFDTIGARFATRPGGYTRILRLGPRQGDGAEMRISSWSATSTRRPARATRPRARKRRRTRRRRTRRKPPRSPRPSRSRRPRRPRRPGSRRRPEPTRRRLVPPLETRLVGRRLRRRRLAGRRRLRRGRLPRRRLRDGGLLRRSLRARSLLRRRFRCQGLLRCGLRRRRDRSCGPGLGG